MTALKRICERTRSEANEYNYRYSTTVSSILYHLPLTISKEYCVYELPQLSLNAIKPIMSSILSPVSLSTSKRVLAFFATNGPTIYVTAGISATGSRQYSAQPLRPSSHIRPQIIPSPKYRKFRSSSLQNQSQHQEEMKDEYGEMTSDGENFVEKDFILENSVVLPQAELRYQTYGQLNEAKDNVVVVCHALTGNASLHTWWGDLMGANKAFDSSKYLIVCCNILGSCYGSTNPQSINPETNTPYGKDFPDVSVKDTVKLQLKLIKEEIGASSIKCVIGGSFGGMQTMEFAVQGGITGGEFVSEDGKYDMFFLMCPVWGCCCRNFFVLFDALCGV